MTTTQAQWASVAEAADLLNLTAGRVRQLLSSGDLEGRKFAGVWVINRKNLLSFAKAYLSGRK